MLVNQKHSLDEDSAYYGQSNFKKSELLPRPVPQRIHQAQVGVALYEFGEAAYPANTLGLHVGFVLICRFF
jgi:hypothetical protein